MEEAGAADVYGTSAAPASLEFSQKGEHENDEIAVIRHPRRACRTGGLPARQVQNLMTEDAWNVAAKKFLGIVLVAVSAVLCTIIDTLIDKEE